PCPEFDRLSGTRIAVANFELRLPLLGVQELGLIEFPYAPVEIAPFFDAGLAWSSEEEPVLEFARRSGERVPVFSTGLSARVNLLGFMVLEAYYAYPFQRPDEGWHWGFNLSPGW
ncbi:MAG: BamA/TamA family outer membrane protein, partial [Longimicrobiales bacterium]